MSLGIVDLAGVCARQQALNLHLFEALGILATGKHPGAHIGPGADQQLFARASHRHAWHAELWAQRSPVLPAHVLGPVDAHRSFDAVNDVATYRAAVRQLADELTDVRGSFDPLLDPSTDRVIELVLADLVQI